MTCHICLGKTLFHATFSTFSKGVDPVSQLWLISNCVFLINVAFLDFWFVLIFAGPVSNEGQTPIVPEALILYFRAACVPLIGWYPLFYISLVCVFLFYFGPGARLWFWKFRGVMCSGDTLGIATPRLYPLFSLIPCASSARIRSQTVEYRQIISASLLPKQGLACPLSPYVPWWAPLAHH